MSGISLGTMAVDRDRTLKGEKVASTGKALVTAIPSEALVLYTGFVAVVIAADVGRQYGPYRWGGYAAFVALAIAVPWVTYQHSKAEMKESGPSRVPLLECFTAAVAAAAWGLVMPGNPLSIGLAGTPLNLAVAAITFGSSALLGLLAVFLRTANDLEPSAPPAAPPGPATTGGIVLSAPSTPGNGTTTSAPQAAGTPRDEQSTGQPPVLIDPVEGR